MSWRDNRSRSICKKIMFSEDEWEQVRKLHEELTRYAPVHRSFSSYARRMLSERRIHVTEIRPLTDPEPIAREIDRIGVNINQIAHWANANEHITPEQVAEIRASFDRIERLLGDLFADKSEAGKDV
ncbi:MobC family plasmid mobilization relaxosome protein [Bifidobacterium pseudocatenulatum]|uniref:MobC family plasmid mobilization relaxosome protein n=1 Tax=Bifidobacterium pseudocatenulatum TaxID=28026 RepID=UPI001B3C4DE4|nr:MobC family plasmid mobilization relaxosome protein [Bifidobacterium pseudocatenulatum]MDB6502242.1 MobC family plasmid mobilization relaxosome protein [Bifidobacterium pseudocatenulatum]